ncbi:MAG: hypothetical protein C3F02_01845 [Parcubacteria group bacterium]|nr:MAG: hypothetical protein C3F02_01845 [Parcubacteria group bacterium]
MKKLLFLGIISLFILTGCFLPDGVERAEDFDQPDIKKEFCGVQLSFQYCKCAFHGQYCQDIGMSKKEAQKYVDEEYEKWLGTKREEFTKNCQAANGYFQDDKCNYCEQGLIAGETSCEQDSLGTDDQDGTEEELVNLPDGPYNEDCTINTEEYDRDWKKYSDIDNAIAPTDRSYEAQQALKAYESMIVKLTETFELQRDIEIEDQMQADLDEYRQAIVQNQKTNLLKAFWRLSWVTFTTIKSGTTAGKSFSNLLTSSGNAVQNIGSALKTFQATVPASSDLAIDKSTLLGKAEVAGAKTALEAVESLGDPGKVVARLIKTAGEASLPSANISEAEINVLKQQQIDKNVVNQVLANSRAANSERQSKITVLESEIKTLEGQIVEWENKEKQRVATALEESCLKLTNPEPVPPEDSDDVSQ